MLASYSSRCDQYHIITDKYVWCYNKKWMKQYHYVQVLWFRRMRRRSSWRKNQEKGSSTIIVNNMEKEQRRRGRKIIFWGYCREATNISCRDIVPMSMNGTIYINMQKLQSVAMYSKGQRIQRQEKNKMMYWIIKKLQDPLLSELRFCILALENAAQKYYAKHKQTN